jgi:hypothetical protein
MSAEPQPISLRRLTFFGRHVRQKINTVHTDSRGVFRYVAVPCGPAKVDGNTAVLTLQFRVHLCIDTKVLRLVVAEWCMRHRASSADLPRQVEDVWRSIDHDAVLRSSPLGVWTTDFGVYTYATVTEIEQQRSQVTVRALSTSVDTHYARSDQGSVRTVAGYIDNPKTVTLVTESLSEMLGAVAASALNGNAIPSTAIDMFLKRFAAHPVSFRGFGDRTESGVLHASIILCRALELPEPNAVPVMYPTYQHRSRHAV